jgi:hypothetical protein
MGCLLTYDVIRWWFIRRETGAPRRSFSTAVEGVGKLHGNIRGVRRSLQRQQQIPGTEGPAARARDQAD